MLDATYRVARVAVNMDSSYTAMLKEHLGVPEFFTPSDDVVSCSRDVPASGVSIQDGSAPTSAKSFVGKGTMRGMRLQSQRK